ncbi:MAG: ScpA family protein [Pseudoclavibacter sp.]|nr:ScpA family protein [Pseudoclavibacter sp.]
MASPETLAPGGVEGPFDLLLRLISQHELDITEIALSRVTDEFISYLAGLTAEEELDRASEFIVVAATLLDMKLVSLLPQGDYVDAEEVAILEARDLLFARLLQYRAFKEAAEWFAQRLGREESRHARSVPLEAKHRQRAPELVWTLGAQDFAALALAALTPREQPELGLGHLHAPAVSIRQQAIVLVERLRGRGPVLFGELIADADRPGVVVARFLAVLELYRRGALSFSQEEALGPLAIRWEAEEWDERELGTLGADYDG